MIVDSVKTSLIQKDLVFSWIQTTQTRLDTLLEQPNITLGHIEELLEAQARDLMLPILSAAAQKRAEQQPFECPKCQVALQVEARHRSRTLDGIFGSFPLKRDYGLCPKCKSYWHPADQALGLQPQAPASPRVQEISALMSLRTPYAQAAQDTQRLTGLSLNASSMHREAQRQGQRAIQCREMDVALTHTPEGVVELSARSATAQISPFTLIIEIDAWNIRERDDWGQSAKLRKNGQEPERWHWVFTGTIFRLDQCAKTKGGRRLITQRGYVATRQSLEAFTLQLYTEAILRGLLHAEQVLILADGAIWIWNLAQARFKEAKQRVDLFHVREHLHELARVLHGQGTPEAQKWLQPLLRFLEKRKDGALDVLHHLEDLRLRLKNMPALQQEALEKEIGYFTTHHKRMDYKQAKANGEPVGSGAVESTARQYQTRFKCTGQFWTLAGDEALLTLATLYRNERWHRLFPHARPPAKGADG